QRGEITFIVGGNGSGKSTLAKLLTGLYSPKSGEIWLDRKSVGEAERAWYRHHFADVFSDFAVFERLFGEGAALAQVANEYLKLLQLDRKVKILNGSLSQTKLSQGQRKRLALLAAYLEDRPIYLFDEWAADQDPAFKSFFYRRLLPDMKARGKTVIVISHD